MRIQEQEEPEYPRVGTPLESVGLVNGNQLKITFRGHILLNKNEGIFVEPDFDSESESLENSAELVVNMRKNGTIG
jgi:hypothetical protein